MSNAAPADDALYGIESAGPHTCTEDTEMKTEAAAARGGCNRGQGWRAVRCWLASILLSRRLASILLSRRMALRRRKLPDGIYCCSLLVSLGVIMVKKRVLPERLIMYDSTPLSQEQANKGVIQRPVSGEPTTPVANRYHAMLNDKFHAVGPTSYLGRPSWVC